MSPVLAAKVISLEARKLMSYRVDFWANSVASFVAEMAVAYFLWQAVFEASGHDRIGGFTFDGMVLYYVLAILVGKLIRGQERGLTIAQDIYEGTLTRYLIFPVPYGAFKYAEHLGALLPALVQVSLFGTAAALWLPVPAELGTSPASVAMAGVAVLGGSLLAFVMRLPIQGLAFWADNVWSLNVMVRFTSDLLGGLMLPLSVFPGPAREVLYWLPFRFLFAFPVETLLGRVDAVEWLRSMGVLAAWVGILWWLSRAIWRRGERVYSGVGI
ncbi:MAG: ABC-2 family transporter protein [Holophagales bacterium]|nr:ABC-2 family transporter protein [Holophagales bacterium]